MPSRFQMSIHFVMLSALMVFLLPAAGSKMFVIASGGSSALTVTTFTGAFKHGHYKPIVLKHGKKAKVSVVVMSGDSAEVVTVTSSNPSVIADFTITVPAGQTTVNNFKTPRVNKNAQGQTVTLTASDSGGGQSVTVTIQ